MNLLIDGRIPANRNALSDLFDLCLQAAELESKIKITNSKRKEYFRDFLPFTVQFSTNYVGSHNLPKDNRLAQLKRRSKLVQIWCLKYLYKLRSAKHSGLNPVSSVSTLAQHSSSPESKKSLSNCNHQLYPSAGCITTNFVTGLAYTLFAALTLTFLTFLVVPCVNVNISADDPFFTDTFWIRDHNYIIALNISFMTVQQCSVQILLWILYFSKWPFGYSR